MSEEQQKQDKKLCTCMVVAVIISLLMSAAALTLSIMNFNGASVGSKEGEKVVISQQYDKGRSLKKAQDTGKPIIVFFYTDWCGFCQRFAPTFDKITKVKDIKKNFAIAFVNCEKDENHALMQEYNVQGFPTVYVVDKNGKKTQLENGTFFNEDSVKVVSENAMDLIDDED